MTEYLGEKAPTEIAKKAVDSFPQDIQFKFPWRKYQKRVLDELEGHLGDDHLHIIAPPGSGKTILGLEVVLRIDKPTLIFAPTVAIRNQWIHRFCELFLQTDKKPDWISHDIKKPEFLTVSTYQGLHAACSGSKETDEALTENEDEHLDSDEKKSTKSNTNALIKVLKAKNIGTIVVDEAHHLKNAWWHSLTEIKKAVNPSIVGLTATPPYDVPYAEWERYIALNGPVDAEISVPELVVEGDLCPHQDYVFFSRPTPEESRMINAYRQRIEALFQEIKADETFIEALEKHPAYQAPNEQLDWIYTHLEYYSATLIFLNAIGKETTSAHLKIIGNKKFKIPKLDYEWIEILLTFYLYKDPENFSQFKSHQDKMANKLKRGGAIERRAINFKHNRKINSFLSSSSGKLESIDKIVEFEHDHLKKDLRMVILTDYIRKEFLVKEQTNDLELNKIGVLPIFEKLRRTNSRSVKIGVLTGSIILIPLSAYGVFKEITALYNLGTVSTDLLNFDDSYLIIKSSGKLKHDIVNIITQLFQDGHIEVLIGTKSLLGEGWDAPSINSLVLASFVGSYVLSNQMRGRAIRTLRENSAKTSNIWHLVCVDPTVPDGGDDIQLLKRRFNSFVGISFAKKVTIENGIGRLNLPEVLKTDAEIANANKQMMSKAGMRDQLEQNWQEALKSGTTLIEEIKVPFPKDQEYREVKSLHFNRTIKYLFAMLASGLISYFLEALKALGRTSREIKTFEEFIYWIVFVGVFAVIIFGRLAFKAFRAYVKYRDIAKDIFQIGEALVETLIKVGTINTASSKLNIVADVDKYGAVFCHLEGGTTYEKSTFIKSLQEIIGTVDSPRYIIIRKNFLLNVFSQKDYHSVPNAIGRKKQFAVYFKKQWRRYVGSCELVYTRTIEGRQLVLESRMHSLASEFEERTVRINKWR